VVLHGSREATVKVRDTTPSRFNWIVKRNLLLRISQKL
jgi:hypothetical protein